MCGVNLQVAHKFTGSGGSLSSDVRVRNFGSFPSRNGNVSVFVELFRLNCRFSPRKGSKVRLFTERENLRRKLGIIFVSTGTGLVTTGTVLFCTGTGSNCSLELYILPPLELDYFRSI